VGLVCENLEFCVHDYGPYPDPVPAKEFILNLDLTPRQRWKSIWGLPFYKSQINEIIDAVLPLSVDHLYNVELLGDLVLETFPTEYQEEIIGGAEALNISAGLLALVNIGYEIQDYCTSIVADDPNDGTILHARNMDFGVGLGFTSILKNITIQIDFQTNNKTLFKATTFVGFIGFLSAMKPGGFAMTIDTRFLTGGLLPVWEEIIYSIIGGNPASLVSFLARDTVASVSAYKDAYQKLANTPLFVDVYFILSGIKTGEGVVISRNETGPYSLWMLNATQWYVLVTNYDPGTPSPWYDDRTYYAIQGMNAIGRQNVSLMKMFGVLSTKPVLNKMTVYSILMKPATGEYQAWTRYCNDPCPE